MNASGLSASSLFQQGRGNPSDRTVRLLSATGTPSRLRRITSPSLRRARTSLSPGIRLYWSDPLMDGESILLATRVRRRLPSGIGSKCVVSRERQTLSGYIPLAGLNQKTIVAALRAPRLKARSAPSPEREPLLPVPDPSQPLQGPLLPRRPGEREVELSSPAPSLSGWEFGVGSR